MVIHRSGSRGWRSPDRGCGRLALVRGISIPPNGIFYSFRRGLIGEEDWDDVPFPETLRAVVVDVRTLGIKTDLEGFTGVLVRVVAFFAEGTEDRLLGESEMEIGSDWVIVPDSVFEGVGRLEELGE